MISTNGGGDGKVAVCVTGASGFIASWLVKLLLQRGYTVNGGKTKGDEKKTTHLLGLDGAKERLHLFKANLLEEGSFDSAIEGCVGVFHTASPVALSTVDPQRMVLTSSVASVVYTGKPVDQDSVADETWLSDPEFCKEHKLWYPLGKTLAEMAAWDFAKENGIDMVTIHPGFVIGPFLHPALCTSVGMILSLVNGNKIYPKFHCWSVDVRDVAEAHIKAFDHENQVSASGRYCLVGSSVPFSQVLGILHKLYPTLPLADKYVYLTRPFSY
ncbi:unnamed protein product [Linum tenue]|uniref:NAD-dependent epimerase/dehydratase domain-containing protein n=1 Tax=Linum tenue TaxID=586396 RepID=A0AAV0NA76_9ROSI|nr:unnamed protein product [Linum tenue]